MLPAAKSEKIASICYIATKSPLAAAVEVILLVANFVDKNKQLLHNKGNIMNKQEEQAKIMAVLKNSDQQNNPSTIPNILAEIRRRHLERAAQVTTQVVDK